jgi:Endonuclease/Exonuclease/phosphatase family
MSPRLITSLSLIFLGSFINLSAAEETKASTNVSVIAFNVENLFDLDDQSLYADFPVTSATEHHWTPEKLAGKLQRLAEVLRTAEDGKGPSILILDELEADHTPNTTASVSDFLAAQKDKNYKDILKNDLSDELRGMPIENWLIKALEDEGLKGYQVVLGDVLDLSKEAIHCGLLTRLPIKSTKQLHVQGARTIVEAEVELAGESVYVYANHWKSGAGDAGLEKIRMQNAGVLRKRLDEIFKTNPDANVIIAGDLNTHYNQLQRYPKMGRTAVQDVLGSQGNIEKFTSANNNGAVLYNLWYDVEPSQRRSDTYQGEWGTLMQIIISKGLANGSGVDYVGGSFGAVVIDGLNAKSQARLPNPVTLYGPGAGISDHFPVIANFTVINKDEKAGVPLKRAEITPSEALPEVAGPLDRSKLPRASSLEKMSPEELSNSFNDLFLIDGTFLGGGKKTSAVKVGEKTYNLYLSNPKVASSIKSVAKGTAVQWVGILHFHNNELEFEINNTNFLLPR